MSLEINEVSMNRKPVPESYEEEEGNLTFLSNVSADEANTSFGSSISKSRTKNTIDNLFESSNNSVSHGNSQAYKKKDQISVSNNIKALQDKIKKGLDIKDDENMPVRRFRINKSNQSPAQSDTRQHDVDTSFAPKKLSFTQSISDIKNTSQSSIDLSRDETTSPTAAFSNNHNLDSILTSPAREIDNEKTLSSNSVHSISKSSTLDKIGHDDASINNDKSTENPFTTSFTKKAAEHDDNGSFTSTTAANNKNITKLKIANVQFKVLQKGTPVNSPLILSPSGNAYDTADIDSRSIISAKDGTKVTKDLRQLQLIDKEITRKIKKIKNEIQFIDDSLPPNPCTYDIETRKNLARAREVLSKKLDFWDKKKYENGIALSKVSRKMVYSGGEEVTTFFSGRSE